MPTAASMTRSRASIDLSRAVQANLGLRVDDYGAEFTSTRNATTGERSQFEPRQRRPDS